jgi:hypothetical protein
MTIEFILIIGLIGAIGAIELTAMHGIVARRRAPEDAAAQCGHASCGKVGGPYTGTAPPLCDNSCAGAKPGTARQGQENQGDRMSRIRSLLRRGAFMALAAGGVIDIARVLVPWTNPTLKMALWSLYIAAIIVLIGVYFYKFSMWTAETEKRFMDE